MSEIKIPRIMQKTDSYVRQYPEIVRLANKQLEEQFWTSSEMKVELDRMTLLYKLNEEQLHAVKTVLHLFLRYELMVGDFWGQVVANTFPRPEVRLAASVIDAVEKGIHAEFYNQFNVVLGLDTDEHYLAYIKDPELKGRVDWLKGVLGQEDKVLATIIFSMTETALLFSSFAILKSFQSNGYNLIPVVVRGTNQSAIDEDLHGQVSSEIVNTYYAEMGTTLQEDTRRYEKVLEAVHYAYLHECRIIDMAITKDSLNGVPKQEFKEFVKHRLNIYLERLGLPHEFEVGKCSVVDWFEKNTYAYKVVDFFSAGIGMEYESSWNESAFGNAWTKEQNDN
jgi:ribonucleotide reductase beta subunit family protein with ferritin-like domain